MQSHVISTLIITTFAKHQTTHTHTHYLLDKFTKMEHILQKQKKTNSWLVGCCNYNIQKTMVGANKRRTFFGLVVANGKHLPAQEVGFAETHFKAVVARDGCR